jgi:hypothetical protein
MAIAKNLIYFLLDLIVVCIKDRNLKTDANMLTFQMSLQVLFFRTFGQDRGGILEAKVLLVKNDNRGTNLHPLPGHQPPDPHARGLCPDF